MRIGIDLFSLDRPGGNFGVGRGVYAWNLLPHLFRLGREHHFVVFVNRENESLVLRAENVEKVRSRLPNRIRPFRIFHEQIGLLFSFWRRRLDLIHMLGNDTCLWLGKRTVLTVYDFMWNYYLKHGRRNAKYLYFSFSVPFSLRRAGALIAISRFIAEQAAVDFPYTIGKLFPIPLACPPAVPPHDDVTVVLNKKYPFSFVFTLTTSLPHKNLSVLLQAFQTIKRRGGFSGKLVVCGQLKGDFHKETLSFIENNGLGQDVILTGFLAEEEKQFLLSGATLFVFPSLYEGFGLPLLEAMKAGVPVVAAAAASLPEVGGEACRYFAPGSAEELAKGMAEVLGDPQLAERLKEKGKARASLFSWEETAKKTLEVYENLHAMSTKNQGGTAA